MVIHGNHDARGGNNSSWWGCLCDVRFASKKSSEREFFVPAGMHLGVNSSMASLGLYPRCYWMPPLGEYLPRIAPADAMVINFGVKIELWRCGKHFPKLAFKTHETDPLLSSSEQQAA